ncbi:MAG: DUF5058 family protein [Oscillospiraceae bacterium]|nr:DUF5058 family protein [Oscillospiraceae bacterium]
MVFNVNSPILFVVAGVAVAVVLAQSICFLLKAWRRAQELGMDMKKLRRTARTAAVFTIAPAAAIVISVITLSKDLGVPLPWLRLSVVGNLSYETIAATNAESAMGLTFGQVSALTAQQYVTIAAVMTVSILIGIWLVPLIGERLLNGMITLENRDKKWGEIFSASMFIGMISAFIGYVFCDFSGVFHGDLAGLVPVCVMTVSALVMTALGLTSKRKGLRVLADYALPVSLIAGMASAVPFTAWLG